MVRMSALTSILVAAGLAACSSSTPTTQTITGKIETSSFPESVSAVRAVGTNATVEAKLASDGTFSLTLPAGDRYRISMVSAVRESTLVFPRATGTIDTSVAIAGAAASRDVGTVRYLHDAAGHSFDCGNQCTPGSTNPDGSTCVHDDGDGSTPPSGGEGSGTDPSDGSGGHPPGDGSGAHPDGDGSGTPPDGDTGSGAGGDDGGASCGGTMPEPPGSAHPDGDTAICDQNLPPSMCGDGDSEDGSGSDSEDGSAGEDPGTAGND
ncbi:MAG TPA: hypothetical protein VGM90_14240 [Kofleriaceae bacterium]|jgi:hypothetical protein